MLNAPFIHPCGEAEARTVDRFAGVSYPEPPPFVPQIAPNGSETPEARPIAEAARVGLEVLAGPPPRADRMAQAGRKVVLRCSPEWHAWAVGFADWMGVSITVLVEQALRRMAEGTGYPALPPRRYRPSPRARRTSA